MKKILSTIFMICILLCGCYENSKDIPDTHKKYEYAGDNITTDMQKERFNYTNSTLGFGLNFPESWNEFYKVEEYDSGITVMFYGKSFAGQGIDVAGNDGLTMFFILNEEEVNSSPYDSIEKIGTAKGVDYYYATTTDVSLAPIMLIDDNELKQLRDLYGEKIYCDDQLPIIRKDWKKAQEMQKEIPELLETFGEIS